MNLLKLLPTQKVTAFLIGGALTIVGFWLLVDVSGVLESMPDALVLSSVTLLIGAVVAWIVPEGMWERLQSHVGDVDLPDPPEQDPIGH